MQILYKVEAIDIYKACANPLLITIVIYALRSNGLQERPKQAEIGASRTSGGDSSLNG